MSGLATCVTLQHIIQKILVEVAAEEIDIHPEIHGGLNMILHRSGWESEKPHIYQYTPLRASRIPNQGALSELTFIPWTYWT